MQEAATARQHHVMMDGFIAELTAVETQRRVEQAVAAAMREAQPAASAGSGGAPKPKAAATASGGAGAGTAATSTALDVPWGT